MDMQPRRLRIIKPPLPPLGICERCNLQFRSNSVSQSEAEIEIRAAFDSHECEPTSPSVRIRTDDE